MDSFVLEERFQEPASWQWRTITNSRGMQLRYGGLPVAEKPAAHIVFVEGRGGFAEETFELSRDFNRQSMGFWVLDRAGQGMSDRYLSNRFKMHAEHFSEDRKDLVQMIGIPAIRFAINYRITGWSKIKILIPAQ